MNKHHKESFSIAVVQKLKNYVYRLIDPRNGETFYVGKGNGNRVFSHIQNEKGLEGDEFDNKMQRIREIRLAGFEIVHVIHRHGMDEKTAFEVESAVIDAYPGLTNIIGGAGGNDHGVMHANEIRARYCAMPAVFKHDKILLICVNKTADERPLYDATRYAWRLNKSKAKDAEVILAVQQGMIKGAFVAHSWMEAVKDNFPVNIPGRFGFEGKPASDAIKKFYVGKRVPDEYCKQGAANPIKYTW